ATDEVNGAGGLDIGGKKVQVNLKILDDGSDATKSRSLVEQLATQEKVNALLGGYDTVLVQAQQGVPDQYKIPMVEGGGAASAIFTRGNKYLFGTLATIDDLGNITMDFLKYWIDQGKLPKPLRIALAWENTDHGKDYQAAVNKAAKDDPGHFQVVLDQSFDLNGSDFTPLLTQVKAANADAFLSDAHLPDFITMHRQYTQVGLKHKFVTYGARGPDQKGREALSSAADYLVAGLWWTPALTDQGSRKFTDTCKGKFNVTPDWFQPLAYDPARVLYAGLHALMSFGLELVYGVMKIINLAHGGTMMLGAFVVLSLNRALHLDPILGAVVSAALFFVLGMALYRVAVRRVVNAPPIASLL